MWFKKKGQTVVESITNISKTYPNINYRASIIVSTGEGYSVELGAEGENKEDTVETLNDLLKTVKDFGVFGELSSDTDKN